MYQGIFNSEQGMCREFVGVRALHACFRLSVCDLLSTAGSVKVEGDREGDAELLVNPLHQILQASAHNAVDRRDRTALHNLKKGAALIVIQLALFATKPGSQGGAEVPEAHDEALWATAIDRN